MRKIIFLMLALSACSPEQSLALQNAGAAMQQAGQPSAYPVSPLQGINAGLAGYNGVPLNQNPYAYVTPPIQQQSVNCMSHRTGIWVNTTCY